MNTNEDDKKRPAEDVGNSHLMDGLVAVAAAAAAISDSKDGVVGNKKKKQRKQSSGKHTDGAQISAARARRLEQNRRAAIESRRRKKVMIAELQRSVAFYSKANENLKKSNEELEASLLIAKHKLNQTDRADSAVATEGGVKTPEDERIVVESSPEPKIEQQPAPAAISATFASLMPPVNSLNADQAQFFAMQAVYENMGYPAAAVRSAASGIPQFDTGLNDAKKPDPVSVDSDEYIQSLEQFAMQKTAAANAATLAANTALRIASWHKMMKASGQKAEILPPPVPSMMEEK